MTRINTVPAISNDIKKVAIGEANKVKGRDVNDKEASFSEVVNSLRGNSINEEEKLLKSDGQAISSIECVPFEIQSQEELEDIPIPFNENILSLLITETLTPSNNHEKLINEEASISNNDLVSRQNEANELLGMLGIRSLDKDITDSLSVLTTNGSLETFRNVIEDTLISEASRTEARTFIEGIDRIEPVGESNPLGNSFINSDFQDKGDNETLIGKKIEEIADKIDGTDIFGELEEKLSIEDDRFLKSLLEDKSSNSRNYYTTVSRTLLENEHSFEKEVPVIHSTTIKEDVIKVINYASIGNIKELKVRINPEELGTMVVKLSLEENTMKAKLKVSSEETYKLLLNNYEDLKNTLKAKDIEVHEIEISLFNEEGFYYSQENRGSDYREHSGRNDSFSHRDKTTEVEGDREALMDNEGYYEGSVNSLV